MELVSINNNLVILHHGGVLIETRLEEWEHPVMPGGEEDNTVLISPQITTEDGIHTMTISLHGDARAQMVFAALYPSAKDQVRMRGLILRNGGAWMLDDDGNPPSTPPDRNPPPFPQETPPQVVKEGIE